jgi:hypothetical protein
MAAADTYGVTPQQLLETSVGQLRTLSAFLGEQLGEQGDGITGPVTSETRACREILGSLRVLILRLQVAGVGHNGDCPRESGSTD